MESGDGGLLPILEMRYTKMDQDGTLPAVLPTGGMAQIDFCTLGILDS